MPYSHESNVPSPPANELGWYVHEGGGEEEGGKKREDKGAEGERKGGDRVERSKEKWSKKNVYN